MEAELSDAEKAYQVYTQKSLAFYAALVLGLSNRFIWRSPSAQVLSLFREHLSENHLDVGGGTGYFLKHSLPEGRPRIALLDANRDCLEFTAKRIAQYKPELHQEDITEPLELRGAGFDSISINGVFHCLPGPLEEKFEFVLNQLMPHLHENGVIFGSTILGAEIQQPFLAKAVMGYYNKKGIFSNQEDGLGAVMTGLSKRFKTFNVEVLGSVVLFWGKGKKGAGS